MSCFKPIDIKCRRKFRVVFKTHFLSLQPLLSSEDPSDGHCLQRGCLWEEVQDPWKVQDLIHACRPDPQIPESTDTGSMDMPPINKSML